MCSESMAGRIYGYGKDAFCSKTKSDSGNVAKLRDHRYSLRRAPQPIDPKGLFIPSEHRKTSRFLLLSRKCAANVGPFRGTTRAIDARTADLSVVTAANTHDFFYRGQASCIALGAIGVRLPGVVVLCGIVFYP